MSTRMRDLGIDQLGVDERLELMHEIWDSIVAEPGRTYLTDAQQRELEHRFAQHEADPGDGVPWEQIKAEALARFQRR